MEKNPFSYVQPWIPQILHTIKKEIKRDHLGSDKQFLKTHFGNNPLAKISFEEIFTVYERELMEGNEALVAWVINAWVFKNGDLYRHFAERLSEVNPDFSQLVSLTEEQEARVLEGAIEAFGVTNVYLFSRLNGVVFSDLLFDRLHQESFQAMESKKREQEEKEVRENHEQIISRLMQEKTRLQDKYEDKLAGVQRKYMTDVEALKKQIRSLQQQLVATKNG